MGFHGQAPAHKSKITMRDAKHQLEGCKACHRGTLEQRKRALWSDNHACLSGSLMDKSGFGGCQENITYWNKQSQQ